MLTVSPSPEQAQPEDASVPPTIPGLQPEPLEELAKDERAEWAKFTARMPADWFPPETWPMLAQLCRHVCQGRWVGQCLQEARAGLCKDLDDDNLEKVERLQRLHDREGRAMTALMVRLRLTSQQRIADADVADRAREKVKQEHVEVPPWAASARRIAAGVERRQ
jgi:hypothetical protein